MGRYELTRILGSGGMGEVYLAHDPQLDRPVAIKLLPAHLAGDAVARARLRREALAAASLDHPFICKIFEVAEEAGTLFLVMEYIRGETLQQRLNSGRLPISEALRIAEEVAEAIEEAHSNGLIHRDLKPANIMLTSQGRVKVMDFGLVKRTLTGEGIAGNQPTVTIGREQMTERGIAVGTPEYMSPEQITGAPIDQRSDLFSFGILLWRMLTGRSPFRLGSTPEILAAILRDPPDLSIAATAQLAPGLLLIVRRLLAKAPADRYPSMREVRADMLGLAGQTTALPEIETKPSPRLIGREQELAELRRLLDAALAGHGSMALIGGEPGIGKTHLTRALLHEAARRGCLTMVGHFYEMEGAPPYVAFIEMLEYCARVAPRESFRYSIGDAAPEVARLMPELRRMFPDIPPAADLPPEQQRRFLFNAYREFVERSARVTPIVAVFDDLHWADEPALLLLLHLAQTVSTVPILIIGTYRDGDLDSGKAFARVLESCVREKLAVRMTLRRLGLPGVQAMLAARGGQSPPPSLAGIVFDETDGNPFFVEEVFESLAEQGKLFDDRGAWRSGLQVGELQVPRGVRLVIGQRLDRLREETRRVLRTAAVIGRFFNLRLLEELENGASDAAIDALEEAERANLVIAERSGREMRYRFSHELVRQTLAEALSLPRRQRLHLRIADAIERMHGANPESQASALAYHLCEAGASADLEKTIAYLVMAARQALAGVAHEDALVHIEKALSLMQTERDTRIGELHMARAIALRGLSRIPEAIQAFELAAGFFIGQGDIAGLAEVTFCLAYIHGWRREFARGHVVVDRALSQIGTQASPLLHRLLLVKSVFLGIAGDVEASFATFADAKQIEAALPPEAVSDGFTIMGEAKILYYGAQFERSCECSREARRRFRAEGNSWTEADAYEFVAAPLWLGRLAEAETLLRDSLSLAEKVGHLFAVWMYQCLSISLFLSRADLPGAERAAHDANDLGRTIQGGWDFLLDFALGIIAHYRGDLDEAIRSIRTGLDREPVTQLSGQLSGALFLNLAARGDDEAEAALRDARRWLPVPGRLFSFGSCSSLPFVVEGLALLGRLEEAAFLQPHAEHVVASGTPCLISQQLFRTSAGIAAACGRNWPRAEEHHRLAIQQSDSAPYRIAQPNARFWYAEMLLMRALPGDRDKARELLTEAHAMHQTIGMPWHARRVADRIASLELRASALARY